MNAVYKALLLIILCIFSNAGFSQLTENYFSEQDVKDGGKATLSLRYKNQIIVGGTTFDRVRFNPNIICFDTTGNVVWQTIINDTSPYINDDVTIDKLILGSDSFVYAVVVYSYYTDSNEMWKVDPDNGNIVWKKNLPPAYGAKFVDHFMDYDSSRLIYSYKGSYNGFAYQIKLSTINKSNGAILSNVTLSNVPGQAAKYLLQFDENKNLYFSVADSIFKIDGIDTSKVLWKQSYSSSKMADFSGSYYHQNSSSLLVFGKQSTNKLGAFLKIDATNGNLISKHQGSSTEADISVVKEQSNTLYLAWQHIYVGGGFYQFWTNKYDILNDTILWNSYESMPQLKCQAVKSVDVDNAGDVYLTGYCGADNYGPGDWGIMKLRGTNGTKLFHKTISNDSAILNRSSMGIGAYVINNKPYFVGTIQASPIYYTDRTAITLISLHPNNGSVLIKKELPRSIQFTSTVLSIQKCQNNNVLVFKQIGEAIKMEMYNPSKQLLWEKNLRKDRHFLLGKPTTTFLAGNAIYIATLSVQKRFYKDLYKDPMVDSMQVFKVDNLTGNVIKEYGIRMEDIKIFPTELTVKNDTIFFFYYKQGRLFYRRITNSSISSEHSTNLPYNISPVERKIILDYDATSLLHFARGSINQINKSNLNSTKYLTLPQAIIYPWHILPKDSLVLIMGRNSNANEAVTLFDVKNKDTIWATSWPTNGTSTSLKGVLNATKNYLYTISKNDSDIFIRKIDVNTGDEEWTYKHDSLAWRGDSPLDISYNDTKKEVLITGYEVDNKITNALILALDSTGALISKFSKAGDFAGNNAGTCAYVWDDGVKWVGGNLNKNSYGFAGFIYSLNSCSTSSSSITASTCTFYTSPSGKYTWSIAGIYKDTLSNLGGCDSIITINLTINKANTAVTNANNTLTASLVGGEYQWIDCNGYTPILGDTLQSFTPTKNGNYAVIVTDGNCTDTSACYSITNVGIDNSFIKESISVAPNPSKGIYNISINSGFKKAQISIYNAIGQRIVESNGITANTFSIDMTGYERGIYYLEIINDGINMGNLKLIKY